MKKWIYDTPDYREKPKTVIRVPLKRIKEIGIVNTDKSMWYMAVENHAKNMGVQAISEHKANFLSGIRDFDQ